MHLKPGTLLQGGKYQIVRHISSGGFGNTYECMFPAMGIRVAIKEFFVNDFCNRDERTNQVTVGTQSKCHLVEKLRKKFVDEARAINSMHHDNIVRVSDIFSENNTEYYVMDFIDGCSLHDMLKQCGSFNETDALIYIRQVCDALRYIHSQNRLHLDIKPGNIMVEAKSNKAILIDFGASKHYDDATGENTSTLLGVNTPGYAPPEQYSGFSQFTPSADIYAVGATLYKLLTGVTPPQSVLISAGEKELPPLPSTISRATSHAVYVAMESRKSKRPQSVDDFLALLNNTSEDDATIIEGEPMRPEPQTIVTGISDTIPSDRVDEYGKKEPKKKKTLLFLLIGVFIAIVAAAVNFLTSSKPDVVSPELDEVRTILVNGVDFDMIKVEGGTFTMGATNEQVAEAEGDEYPLHEVSLSTFYIGKTEVTQALWKAVMGNNPSATKGDNYPVETVSWADCQTFIQKLNALTGMHFRLPTEAEREYAARGGQKSRGYKYAGSNYLNEVAWYRDNSGNHSHPVATRQPNELGLYDMSGNVWEWCQDWMGMYRSEAQTNPTGPGSGSDHVSRGGSWRNYADFCRVSRRCYGKTDLSGNLLGLRLVLEP